MAHPEGEVGVANNEAVAAPTLEDRFTAAFGDDPPEEQADDPDEQPQGDAPESDTGDEPDLGEVEIDDADLPAIEPPISLNAEEKEAFKTWPREAQEAISRRVGELEKGLHTKAQEAKAEQQKVEQAAAERIAQVQNVHVQALTAMLPDIPARPDPRLQPRDPDGYANQLAQHEWAVAQHQQAQQLIQHVQAQQEAAARAAAQQEAASNEAILRDKFPDYFGEKHAELEQQLLSTARILGYTDDQLAQADATDVLAMRRVSQAFEKEAKYDTLIAKQMAKVREAKTLPKVSRPGVPQGQRAAEGQRWQADRQAMREGNKDAALRIFAKL